MSEPDASHPASYRPCVDPVPVVVGGQDTGYDTCDGGAVRRRAIVDCPSLVPRPASATTACAQQTANPCVEDSDCTGGPHGECASIEGPGGYCNCAYGCVRDSDCRAGEICVCGDPVGSCAPASCTSGESCAPGAECATYEAEPGCPSEAFACQTPTDACLADSDCVVSGPNDVDEVCAIGGSGSRVCSPVTCAVGRPFLVDGDARVAPLAKSRAWSAAVAPSTDGMSLELRVRLAAEWASIGQMEHASVAAFARFALQLLAVGAPPHLLEATHRAMADETVHAKLAFGLASAYAAQDIGPGALSIDACLGACDLEELVATVVREGCIGETVAAIEAREALELARDPEVRAVLARIAEDETKHAQLAWRTVAWALETGGEPARAWVHAAFEEATRGGEAAAFGREGELLVHGVVDEPLRARLRAAAVRDVVMPCARGLLAPARASLSSDARVNAHE
jgi:hypothetical protein